MNTIPVTTAIRASLANEVRWCADIGMYAIDRSIEHTCHHRTDYCDEKCYNNKLYRMYAAAMEAKDARSEAAWVTMDVDALQAKFGRSRKRQTERARLMTRGETFATVKDVGRVKTLAEGTPGTTWWIPTRAWRNPELRAMIQREFRDVDNVVILASMDPSNTDAEWRSLEADGWATMFFGDKRETTPTGARMFKCPKTWGGIKGACAVCKNGCFKGATKPDSAPVNVSLGAAH